MSKPRTAFIVALGIAPALLASSAISTPAGAASAATGCLGPAAGGGGLTNGGLSPPGPPLTVYVGDNVTLNLTSLDGFNHRWFIDYDGNNVSSGSEPTSPNFGTALHWNFTVSNRTGTFQYRSDRTAGPGDDLSTMWGNITISASPPSNPLLPGGQNTVLILAGALIIVAVIAFAAFFWRRMGKRETPPPPPPQ